MSEPSDLAAPPLEERRGARRRRGRVWLRPDLVYAAALFAAGVVVLYFALLGQGGVLPNHDWPVALFFFVYGLFTITMGYPHPTFGHVSFDRVGQVASILVLGPVDAAWIVALTSFLFPWTRLLRGVSLPSVVMAAMHNAGLMALVVLLSGIIYAGSGGQIPLTQLGWRELGLLLLLMVSMQVLNDLGMMVIFRVRGRRPSEVFNLFSVGVELSAGLMAVLVALVFNRMALDVLVLMLCVLSLGMLVLRQFAQMRYELEGLVEQRTSALRQKSLELERQATHDDLTKLFNRRYADDYLRRELDKAARYGQDFAVALVDVDHFKLINDRYSHARGDEVLRRVAEILQGRCRKTDMIARYGGDEFLLCFPQTSVERATQICEELREAVSAADWSFVDPGERYTLSIGVADSAGNGDLAALLNVADSRLYQAKHAGRNRVAA